MECGLCCSPWWCHISVWAACWRWEHRHVYHWVSFCSNHNGARETALNVSSIISLSLFWSLLYYLIYPSKHFLIALLLPLSYELFFLSSSPLRLQEMNSMINKRLKDALFHDQWSEICMDTLSRFGYVLVSKELARYDVPVTVSISIGTVSHDSHDRQSIMSNILSNGLSS